MTRFADQSGWADSALGARFQGSSSPLLVPARSHVSQEQILERRTRSSGRTSVESVCLLTVHPEVVFNLVAPGLVD